MVSVAEQRGLDSARLRRPVQGPGDRQIQVLGRLGGTGSAGAPPAASESGLRLPSCSSHPPGRAWPAPKACDTPFPRAPSPPVPRPPRPGPAGPPRCRTRRPPPAPGSWRQARRSSPRAPQGQCADEEPPARATADARRPGGALEHVTRLGESTRRAQGIGERQVERPIVGGQRERPLERGHRTPRLAQAVLANLQHLARRSYHLLTILATQAHIGQRVHQAPRLCPPRGAGHRAVARAPPPTASRPGSARAPPRRDGAGRP